MASDIDSFLNLDYSFSVISTSIRISQLKISFIYKHTRPARDNKLKKDFSNERKFFYYNYCSYGNAVIINFHLHFFN
jgi:hypothetical protein